MLCSFAYRSIYWIMHILFYLLSGVYLESPPGWITQILKAHRKKRTDSCFKTSFPWELFWWQEKMNVLDAQKCFLSKINCSAFQYRFFWNLLCDSNLYIFVAGWEIISHTYSQVIYWPFQINTFRIKFCKSVLEINNLCINTKEKHTGISKHR